MAAANSVAEFIKNINHLCLLIINKSQPILHSVGTCFSPKSVL